LVACNRKKYRKNKLYNPLIKEGYILIIIKKMLLIVPLERKI